MTTVATFAVDYAQFLDPNENVPQPGYVGVNYWRRCREVACRAARIAAPGANLSSGD